MVFDASMMEILWLRWLLVVMGSLMVMVMMMVYSGDVDKGKDVTLDLYRKGEAHH